MKRIVLVYALLVAIVHAKAPTTNTQTNCQVIGNQDKPSACGSNILRCQKKSVLSTV